MNFFRTTAIAIAAISLAAGARASATPTVPEEDGLNGTQRDEVMEIVETWIANNPALVAKALARASTAPTQGNVGSIAASATPQAIAAFSDPTKGGAVVVHPGGKLTLAVATDYACPFCRTLEPRLVDLLRRRPEVTLILRETPILTASSLFAAQVGMAVAKEGSDRYMAYHAALMGRKGPLTEQAVLDAASTAGANLAKVADDASSAEIKVAIEGNVAMLRRLKLLATPTLASAGILANGALGATELDALIDGEGVPR